MNIRIYATGPRVGQAVLGMRRAELGFPNAQCLLPSLAELQLFECPGGTELTAPGCLCRAETLGRCGGCGAAFSPALGVAEGSRIRWENTHAKTLNRPSEWRGGRIYINTGMLVKWYPLFSLLDKSSNMNAGTQRITGGVRITPEKGKWY